MSKIFSLITKQKKKLMLVFSRFLGVHICLFEERDFCWDLFPFFTWELRFIQSDSVWVIYSEWFDRIIIKYFDKIKKKKL